MAWLEYTIDTSSCGCAAAATTLTARGFSDLVMEDQGEFEEFLEENRAYWDYIDENLQQTLQGLSRIKIYLEDSDSDGAARLAAAVAELGLSMEAHPLEEQNWEESWKDNYPPQPVGSRLLVLPYWRAQEETERVKVILDPGLTFGTGAHPSTQMVMETMEERVQPGWCCLDLGSGSGILSLTALGLGAARAVGVDIDPKAEDIARENAGYNGFAAPEFTALTGNVTEDADLMARLSRQHYDLLLVNIVADVIIALAPVLPNFMDEKTLLICSGILDVRLPEVLAALEQAGLRVEGIREKEDWRCVAAKKG